MDGRIKTGQENEKFERDINDVLNLNSVRLIQLRQSALTGFLDAMKKRYGKQAPWTPERFRVELKRIRDRDRLPEFAGMWEWWLEREIRRRKN